MQRDSTGPYYNQKKQKHLQTVHHHHHHHHHHISFIYQAVLFFYIQTLCDQCWFLLPRLGVCPCCVCVCVCVFVCVLTLVDGHMYTPSLAELTLTNQFCALENVILLYFMSNIKTNFA